MTAKRSVGDVWKNRATMEGAGVRLHRVFGNEQVPRLDPFLMLDDFGSDNPADYLAGFPWHPHRGIETVTYLDRGTVEHGDSIGNAGAIGPGDVQWMTAGSGIIHQEMPQAPADRILRGFQLWVNLPAKHKMMAPRYRGIEGAGIPAATLAAGVTAKVIAGEAGGVRGPVKDLVVDVSYLDVTAAPAAACEHPVAADHRCLAYVVEGEGGIRRHPGRGRAPGSLRGEGRRGRRGRAARVPLPAALRPAARRAGGLVRPDRHEHRGGAGDGLPRVPRRHVREGRRRRERKDAARR